MSMQYIRDTYGVPAKRGARVIYTASWPAKYGAITGSDGQYLRVRFDGDKTFTLIHPTWEIRYVQEAPDAR